MNTIQVHTVPDHLLRNLALIVNSAAPASSEIIRAIVAPEAKRKTIANHRDSEVAWIVRDKFLPVSVTVTLAADYLQSNLFPKPWPWYTVAQQ